MRFLQLVWHYVRRPFELDVRSLATLRIAVGLLVLADLVGRAGDLRAHYSDAGLLPRGALLETLWNSGWLSVQMATGSATLQLVFFAATGLAAIALVVGYHTTLATAVTWVLVIGFQARNPLVGQGGDIILRLLLFWGMFLPLGARYSIDASLASTDRRAETTDSFAAFAYVVQLCFIYVFAYFLKTGPEWTETHTAVYYALNLEQFTTPIGDWLRGVSALHEPLTVATIALEAGGWVLILIPFYRDVLRTIAVVCFAAMHLGFGAAMHLGLFSFIAVAAWIPLVPSWIWERAEARWAGGHSELQLRCRGDAAAKIGEVIRTFALLRDSTLQRLPAQTGPAEADWTWRVDLPDGDHRTDARALAAFLRSSSVFGWLGSILASPPVRWAIEAAAQRLRERGPVCRGIDRLLPRRDISARPPLLAEVAAGAALLVVFAWNLQTVRADCSAPRTVQRAAVYFRLDQRWDMFAPYPAKGDGWYVVPGELRDGTRVDVFRGGQPVDWSKPEDVSDTFRNQRWRKYLVNLWSTEHRNQRRHFAAYLCRTWNETHREDKLLETFDIYYMRETTPPPGQTPEVDDVELWSHDCFADTAQSRLLEDLPAFDDLLEDSHDETAPDPDRALDTLGDLPRLPGADDGE